MKNSKRKPLEITYQWPDAVQVFSHCHHFYPFSDYFSQKHSSYLPKYEQKKNVDCQQRGKELRKRTKLAYWKKAQRWWLAKAIASFAEFSILDSIDCIWIFCHFRLVLCVRQKTQCSPLLSVFLFFVWKVLCEKATPPATVGPNGMKMTALRLTRLFYWASITISIILAYCQMDFDFFTIQSLAFLVITMEMEFFRWLMDNETYIDWFVRKLSRFSLYMAFLCVYYQELNARYSRKAETLTIYLMFMAWFLRNRKS